MDAGLGEDQRSYYRFTAECMHKVLQSRNTTDLATVLPGKVVDLRR